MIRRRLGARGLGACLLLAMTVAACGGSGQVVGTASPSPTSAPSSPPATSVVSAAPSVAPTPTASASPAGATRFGSVGFERPFALMLPAGWVVGEQAKDMVSVFLPMGPDQGPRLGLDVQLVPKVLEDPCDVTSAEIPAGTSASDLAAWMGTWTPLHASKPVATTVAGLDATAIDEAFDGSTCDVANLWPTPGGYLDPAEHKRYEVLDVGGKRVVVTLVGRDDTWDATLPEGQSVLDSLTFAAP